MVQPGFIFLGEQFAQDTKYQLLKNILVDLFRGSPDPVVSLTSIERMFVCCAHTDGRVTVRHYCVKLKKSRTKVRYRLTSEQTMQKTIGSFHGPIAFR